MRERRPARSHEVGGRVYRRDGTPRRGAASVAHGDREGGMRTQARRTIDRGLGQVVPLRPRRTVARHADALSLVVALTLALAAAVAISA
jgi:hypothetical protein